MNAASGGSIPARLTRLPSWLLTQTAHHTHRLVTEELAAVDGHGYHYRLLASLDEFGPASQADLSRRTGIHFSDMVAAVGELADRKLVDRAPDPADRRRNIVTITPAGRERLEHLEEALIRAQHQLLAPLTAPEREQLTQLLARLLDHHRRRSADWPRGTAS